VPLFVAIPDAPLLPPPLFGRSWAHTGRARLPTSPNVATTAAAARFKNRRSKIKNFDFT
jgi:hypothetical protein